MNVVDDEPKLILDACQGSVTAFEQLVIRYEPRIRRMLYGLTQDRQLVQDLCQETFFSAYRALPQMNGAELRFAPWLYRIALNQYRSEWRRRKNSKILPFSLFWRTAEDANEEQIEEYLVSDEIFEERVVQRDLVQRVLAKLPESSVTCLLLDAEGFSYKEIAQIMQESLSSVRSRLSRSRQKFQQLYRQLSEEGRS